MCDDSEKQSHYVLQCVRCDKGEIGSYCLLGFFQFRSPICFHKGFRLFGRTKVLFDHHQERGGTTADAGEAGSWGPGTCECESTLEKEAGQGVPRRPPSLTELMRSKAALPSAMTATVNTGAGFAFTLSVKECGWR